MRTSFEPIAWILIALALQMGVAAAQPNKISFAGTATLSGYVEDASSGERLVGVTLAVVGKSLSTVTNNYGFFSITLPTGNISVNLSMVGYQTLQDTINLDQNVHLTFRMARQTIVLDDVEIHADAKSSMPHSAQLGKINLSVKQIQSAPRFMGEADVLKTLQLLPGVQQGSEGTSALLVRGGTPDQNMFLLDGTPLYNPSHLLGIFSTFNTSTLKNVDLYKGAFPARFGGRLSSVLDVTTKDGNLHEMHGDFSIGLLAAQLTLEGPIQKGKTSFVVSARRTYSDPIARPIIKSNDKQVENLTLFFHDFNVKLHHRISEDDRLFLSLYSGRDKFGFRYNYGDPQVQGGEWFSAITEDTGIEWGNHTGTLRWNHVFSPKLFSNVSLVASQYHFSAHTGNERRDPYEHVSFDSRLRSGIRDLGMKADFDYRPHPQHAVKAGIGFINHHFTPGSTHISYDTDVNVRNSSQFSNELRGNELDSYVEDEWTVSRRLTLNAGLHGSFFSTQGQSYFYLQPRISGQVSLPGKVVFKAAYAEMAQFLHLLSNNTISLPTDLWVPATRNVKPQLSQQVSAGFSRSFLRNTLDLSVEGYYKNMNNVIEYKEGEAYFMVANNNWESKVTSGNGALSALSSLPIKNGDASTVG